MKKITHLLFEKLEIKYFLIALLISLPLSIFALRQNNLTMIRLRDEVLKIDEGTGDIKQIEPALTELGNYVLNHMNTNLGSAVELPGSFNKAVTRIQKQVEASGSVNSKVYAKAQQLCEDPNIPLTARAQCMQDYVVAHAEPGSDVKELVFPDKSLYSYSFASPFWSPDLAGFSVLFTLLSVVMIVFLILTRITLPLISKIVDNDPLE